MGIMVYSLLWVMQDLYHQPYHYNITILWYVTLQANQSNVLDTSLNHESYK